MYRQKADKWFLRAGVDQEFRKVTAKECKVSFRDNKNTQKL